ncbi:MAG: hypothetical protein CFH06_01102 [Alphaproteobacteria bacterium MarineAlpha3_Bin5]|nr:metal-dependent hydrolase [Magnetovibrio sp.]PPR77786.1 MAG: hypothetical protein CFH06_01102 [Alphaproteobacteria bacterium MarineAlpha3_Bin5]
MDPLSQGLLAANVSQLTAVRKNWLFPTLLGFAAGLAADVDIFIRSQKDPLLFLEYHRQFTHSLVFIPVGALIVTLLSRVITHRYISWKLNYLSCLLGYSTHALLDACTSYGTQLFWPFSNDRIAWNIISIIDPIFTLPILIFVVVAAVKRSNIFVIIGIFWALSYLSIGVFQKERAFESAKDLALSRGHFTRNLTVKPSFANLIVWKSIYEFNGFYYVDAIRLTDNTRYCTGERVEKLSFSKHLPTLDRNSRQSMDIERFRWFSNGYLSFDLKKNLVFDVRYSMLPNRIDPLWGIIININTKHREHVHWWEPKGPNAEHLENLIKLVRGKNCIAN